jgi:hypothetical protein
VRNSLEFLEKSAVEMPDAYDPTSIKNVPNTLIAVPAITSLLAVIADKFMKRPTWLLSHPRCRAYSIEMQPASNHIIDTMVATHAEPVQTIADVVPNSRPQKSVQTMQANDPATAISAGTITARSGR